MNDVDDDDDLFFLLIIIIIIIIIILVFFIFFYNMFGLTPRRMATAACTLLHQVETEVVTGHRTE